MFSKEAIPQGKTQADLNKFSFAGAYLPPRTAFRLLSLQSRIKGADLAADGRELHPHITVKYGLKTDDPEKLKQALAGLPPLRARLGKVSLFQNPKHDVLKIDVDSDDLRTANTRISEAIDNEDNYPEYHPHATIAYLKPGTGRQYLHLNELAGEDVVFDRIQFRDRTGKQHVIKLTETPALDKAAFLDGYRMKTAEDVLPFNAQALAAAKKQFARTGQMAAPTAGERLNFQMYGPVQRWLRFLERRQPPAPTPAPEPPLSARAQVFREFYRNMADSKSNPALQEAARLDLVRKLRESEDAESLEALLQRVRAREAPVKQILAK